MGGAVFIEDGIEHGNKIQYNLVVFCKQSTSLQNDDITPAAFWVTNPNNTLQHNAAAGMFFKKLVRLLLLLQSFIMKLLQPRFIHKRKLRQRKVSVNGNF